MTSKAQVIFDDGKPAFVVLPYKDYMKLTKDSPVLRPGEAEFVPFILSDYIKNPIRLKRIEIGLNQQQLAKLLGVTQGYVSRIESRNYIVTKALIERVTSALAKKNAKSKEHPKLRNKRAG